MKSLNGPLRIGIGGPVGSGKTTLCEMLLKAMRDRYSMAVVTNDIYTKEDALILNRVQAISEDRIVGVDTSAVNDVDVGHARRARDDRIVHVGKRPETLDEQLA